MYLKQVFLGFLAGAIFLLGTSVAIVFEKDNSDIPTFFSVIFTGIAAIATAFAAYSASKSARIAESSSETWKRQMRLNIELEEAKKLKVALNSWYRHFVGEAYRYSEEDILRIGEIQQIQKNGFAINQVRHIQEYLDRYKELWNTLEESFDNAGFISSSFDGRLRLRRLNLKHVKACENLLSYFQGGTEVSEHFFEENCSAIYKCSDWHEHDAIGTKITKIKLEKMGQSGDLEYVVKSNGDYVYASLQDEAQSWYTQIGSHVDAQISEIKSCVSRI